MSTFSKPGIYVLKADLVNPNPDRRRKNMPDLPVWPAGMRVVFREYNSEELPGLFTVYAVSAYEQDCIRGRLADDPKKQKSPDQRWLVMRDQGVWEREEDSAFWALESEHTSTASAWLFQRLIDTGKITLDDLRQAILEER